MQSLVRETFQKLYNKSDDLPASMKQVVGLLAGRKDDILNLLKHIYSKKMDVQKIRIHGNFELQKILLTGKDIVVQDFGGNTARSYSERRLKRSPMKDVADMVTSIYYVAHEGFFENNHVPKEDINSLLPFADQWAFFMSSFFMNAYLQTLNANLFIPNTKEDREMFMETYLLEKALYHFNYELSYRPSHLRVPMQIILTILK
jgi:maltose alpha-D-glucosyltransferase/alpha-amylase